MAPERRVSVRQPVSLPALVGFQSRESQPRSFFNAQIRDISNRGAYPLLPADLRVGQHLRLEMQVLQEGGQSTGLRIYCEAEVIRVEPPTPGKKGWGVAVRILHFDTPWVVPRSSRC